jgi:hypothetical protein
VEYSRLSVIEIQLSGSGGVVRADAVTSSSSEKVTTDIILSTFEDFIYCSVVAMISWVAATAIFLVVASYAYANIEETK